MVEIRLKINLEASCSSIESYPLYCQRNTLSNNCRRGESYIKFRLSKSYQLHRHHQFESCRSSPHNFFRKMSRGETIAWLVGRCQEYGLSLSGVSWLLLRVESWDVLRKPQYFELKDLSKETRINKKYFQLKISPELAPPFSITDINTAGRERNIKTTRSARVIYKDILSSLLPSSSLLLYAARVDKIGSSESVLIEPLHRSLIDKMLTYICRWICHFYFLPEKHPYNLYWFWSVDDFFLNIKFVCPI